MNNLVEIVRYLIFVQIMPLFHMYILFLVCCDKIILYLRIESMIIPFLSITIFNTNIIFYIVAYIHECIYYVPTRIIHLLEY